MTGNNGNLKQQTITADPTHQWVQYYEYDEVNRLSIAAENAPLPANCTGFTGSWCREFDYDHFGNKATGSNRVMHQAKPVQLSQTDIATNRLTAATYDAAGNMTSHPVITPGGTITYDANNKKKTFTKTGLSVTTYYDANDRRVREDKVKGAVTTQTVWVYNAFGALVAEYSDAAPTVADGVYYRTTDHLGSTRIVTDDTGQVRQRRDFFPFGEEIPGDANHGNRNAMLDGGFVTYNASLSINQQFTGQQRDADTELDDFLARCFCAPLGVFTGADPENRGASVYDPRGWNGFAYVFNNPYRWIDPDGRQPIPCPDCPPQPPSNPDFKPPLRGPVITFPIPRPDPQNVHCRMFPNDTICPGALPQPSASQSMMWAMNGAQNDLDPNAPERQSCDRLFGRIRGSSANGLPGQRLGLTFRDGATRARELVITALDPGLTMAQALARNGYAANSAASMQRSLELQYQLSAGATIHDFEQAGLRAFTPTNPNANGQRFMFSSRFSAVGDFRRNRARLLHEALHTFGVFDGDINRDFGVSGASVGITNKIMNSCGLN